jgi:5'(3')-deoxyribonucleotidase
MTSTGIDPTLVAFDIDGVVADTMGLFLDIAASDYQVTGVRYEDISCYYLDECIDMDTAIIDAIVERLLEGDYRQLLKPFAGASEVLRRMAKTNGRVLFVTARPHPGPLENWFVEALQMPPEWVDIVATGSSQDKADILLRRGIAYFVEDRLDTCFALHKIGVAPIVFRQPWNREAHPFLEVGSWAEIGRLLALPAAETCIP